MSGVPILAVTRQVLSLEPHACSCDGQKCATFCLQTMSGLPIVPKKALQDDL